MKTYKVCEKCGIIRHYSSFLTSNETWCKPCRIKFSSNFLFNNGIVLFNKPTSVTFTAHIQRLYDTFKIKTKRNPKKYHIDDLCTWEAFFTYCKRDERVSFYLDKWAKSGYKNTLKPVVKRLLDTKGFSISNIYIIPIKK